MQLIDSTRCSYMGNWADMSVVGFRPAPSTSYEQSIPILKVNGYKHNIENYHAANLLNNDIQKGKIIIMLIYASCCHVCAFYFMDVSRRAISRVQRSGGRTGAMAR